MGKKTHALRRAVVVSLIVGAMALAVGCAPQQSSPGDGEKKAGSDNATQATWSMSGDCMTCHTTEGKEMTNGDSGACLHAKESQLTCVSCHTDEKGLAKAHEKATATDTMPKRLNETTISVDTCKNAQCHNVSQEEYLALTAGSMLTDEKGTTVDPHEVIGRTPGHEDITCVSCHTMHTDDRKADSKGLCSSCHHTNVYECNTCH